MQRGGRKKWKKTKGTRRGGISPEGLGEGLLRDGAGRMVTGDGSEGVITAASRDAVLGVLAGLATEVARAV